MLAKNVKGSVLVSSERSSRNSSSMRGSWSDVIDSVTIMICECVTAGSVEGWPVLSQEAIRSAIGLRPPRSVAKKQKTSVNGERSWKYRLSAAIWRWLDRILSLNLDRVFRVVPWHLSICTTLWGFCKTGKSPSAKRIGLSLNIVDGSTWRCISPCCRWPIDVFRELEEASSFSARALDALPIRTKRVGFCDSKYGRLWSRTWARSE